VVMRTGNNTVAGISPVILEARLRIGQYVDAKQKEYIAIQPLFVLANPYNFPITDPGGGLDFGYRINTNTSQEWGIGAEARNNDRNNPHISGVGFTIGYDVTQTQGNTTLRPMVANYGSNYFTSTDAQSNGVTTPGYYPILKNPVSFTTFRFPGVTTLSGNRAFNSALDNVAFHIPHLDVNNKPFIMEPGEAKVFILADANHRGFNETTFFGGSNANNTYSIDPNVTVVAGVGSSLATNGNIFLTGNQIIPVPLMQSIPQPNQQADNYMVRDTGITHTLSSLKLQPQNFPTANSVTSANLNITQGNAMTDVSQVGLYENQPANLWPSIKYGYISTAYSSVAMTLELRYDITDITPTTDGNFGGTTPVITGNSVTAGSFNVAGDGQNILQTITNIDLTGDGYFPSSVYTASGSMNVEPSQGYRRQYLGSQDSPPGHLPAFLFDFGLAMSMPGPSFNPSDGEPLEMQTDGGASTAGITGNFDPGQQGTYRTFYDYNLRAVNMNPPPFVPMNPSVFLTSNTASKTLPAAAAFICLPPYGRYFSQGPGDDDTVNPLAGVLSYTYGLGHSVSFQTTSSNPNANLTADTGWGYSLGGNYTSGVASGPQYTVLYSIPTRTQAAAGGMIPNPNGQAVPDVAMISLGQLQHADLTADDFWVSVGYQPGNAFGNSYASYYTSRRSSEFSHNMPTVGTGGGWAGNIMLTEPNPSNSTAVYYRNASNTAYAYDISYLLNVALWDRYFFSTLSETGATTRPANSRLKYAAGYTPTSAQLGVGNNTTVPDPATGLLMFPAYAPARYMMIDGAFNINSTSVEAWKAILSALRGVPYNSNGTGNSGSSAPGLDIGGTGSQVVYFPRNAASPDLAAETFGGSPVNSPSIPGNATSAGISDSAGFAGFRQLTDYQIDMLAAKIVQQVRYRGPFLSLAQFVNRRLSPSTVTNAVNDPTSVSGAIQTAIDISSDGGVLPSLNNLTNATIASGSTSPTSMNTSLLPGTGVSNLSLIYPDGNAPFGAQVYASGSADPNSRLVGIPGWLTQADILEALAPILSARSDTFLIRTYGEVIDPSINQKDIGNSIAQNPNIVLSRAWCELVVQRMPDYVATDAASLNDPSVTSGLAAPNPAAAGNYNGKNDVLSPVNATFGRRFRIISVKWLSASDI
jgi:hypothetical protein